MSMNEKRGWPGMLGNVYCMHWTWKNFPKAWHGQFCGKSHDPTIVLEAIAYCRGSLNGINVLHIPSICYTSYWGCSGLQLQSQCTWLYNGLLSCQRHISF
jgi:hypothetical protein